MVLASKTVVRNRSRLFSPASNPIQPSGMPSESDAFPTCKFSVRSILLVEAQRAYFGSLVKLVPSDVVNRKDQLDIVLFCLFHESCHLFGAICVKQGVSDLQKVNR